MNQTNAEYELKFQTRGVSLLFTDTCVRFYLQFDGLIFQHDNLYKQFVRNGLHQEMQLAYKEAYHDVNSVEKFCTEFQTAVNEFMSLGSQFNTLSRVTVSDFEKAMELIATIQTTYGKLDPMYTDLLFDDTERDTEALKTMVIQKKNILREDFNKIYFLDESPFLILQKTISRQTSIPIEHIAYLTIEGLRNLMNGAVFTDHYAKNNDYVVIREHDTYQYLLGDEATKFILEFENPFDIIKTETFGTSVSKKGVFKGKVKKVEIDYNNFEKNLKIAMDYSDEGYVLIADATIPELVPLMRNAVAIVTNVGGFLSHAAITSRELNIPCIVGTKDATMVFKDGDMVEVDAERGVVTILERKNKG